MDPNHSETLAPSTKPVPLIAVSPGRNARTAAQLTAALERRRARVREAAACPLPDQGFVGVADLLARLRIGKTTLNTWILAGKIPAPVKLSAKTRVWPVGQVRDLLDQLGGAGDAR